MLNPDGPKLYTLIHPIIFIITQISDEKILVQRYFQQGSEYLATSGNYL